MSRRIATVLIVAILLPVGAVWLVHSLLAQGVAPAPRPVTQADLALGKCPKNVSPLDPVDFKSSYLEARRRHICGQASAAVQAFQQAEGQAAPAELTPDFYGDFAEAADDAGDFESGQVLVQKQLELLIASEGADSQAVARLQGHLEARADRKATR